MSEATKQAVQDAIAAHIADENAAEGNSIEYLTDWHLVAAAAISDDVEHTSYWFELGVFPPTTRTRCHRCKRAT